MKDKLLDQTIDEAVAQYILKKVDEHTAAVSEQAASEIAAAKATFQAKAEKLFSFADKKIAEERQALREEYSAKLVGKLEEKNRRIADLEEEVEDFKEQMTERVNTFLANSKDEVRTLVQEEARVDAEEFKSQHIIEQIRDLVGAQPTPVVGSADSETEVEKLKNDVEALKERVAQKNQVNKYLKAQLRKAELVEGVPSADRDFYLERLEGVETVEEADQKFAKVKKALDKSRLQQIEEDMKAAEPKGQTVESSSDDFEDIPTLDEAEKSDWVPQRWKDLANI